MMIPGVFVYLVGRWRVGFRFLKNSKNAREYLCAKQEKIGRKKEGNVENYQAMCKVEES